MPAAICEKCEKVRHYRNQRGFRLSSIKCDCGGRLVAAVRDGNTIVKKQSTAANKGKTLKQCAVCQRKAYQMRLVGTGTTFQRYDFSDGHGPTVDVAAGSHVCKYHKEADHVGN